MLPKDMQVEALAISLHDHYRGFHPSLPPWDALPEAKREINRAQVRDFPALTQRYGMHDMEALAAGAHEVWMRFCEKKDDLRIVPYDALSEDEKEKDRQVVQVLLVLFQSVS